MSDTTDDLKSKIEDSYAAIARQVMAGSRGSCCGGDRDPASTGEDPITRDLYSSAEASEIPAAALDASLGCGNPTALIDLHDGQTVLDLGSGGGIDVLLSARRVGPSGFAYGLDMTDDMLELARRNQAEAGVTNVEFLKGEIEAIPLPDSSVDVIISNCVINLSSVKQKVFTEAFRVLRPGGRFAVSDIVIDGEIDPEVRSSVEAWIGCVAGAIGTDEYRAGLAAAGFVDIEIEPTRVYTLEDAREFLTRAGIDMAIAEKASGRVLSAFVRGRKPAGD